ncbi:MAG: hypothetical protein RLZZ609_2947 [Cyanobacteriota bacterium]|jgi:hypothetical protein
MPRQAVRAPPQRSHDCCIAWPLPLRHHLQSLLQPLLRLLPQNPLRELDQQL